MAKAVLIFNGIQFSFPVVGRAFEWAKENNGSLVAIFLKANKETKEGYIFPSDLDSAENLTSNEDAERGHERIIESNILMLEHRAISEHVDVTSKLLSSPSQEELLEQFTGCELIFVQADMDKQGILTVDSIDLKKLLKHSPLPTEIVPG